MILSFPDMEEAVLPRFKGGEGAMCACMTFDGLNRILRGRLGKHDTVGLHTHEDSSEIIFVAQGVARVLMDGAEELVPAGCAHYCPKGHTHSVSNGGEEELVFYAVVPMQ